MRAFIAYIVLFLCGLECVAQNFPITSVDRIPTMFVRNEGQWSSEIRYKVLPDRAGVEVVADGLKLIPTRLKTGIRPLSVEVPLKHTSDAAAQISFHNPSQRMRLHSGERLGTKVNVIEGIDSSRWQRNVPATTSVSWENVWDGVDISLDLKDERIVQHIRVLPGADAENIEFNIRDNSSGELLQTLRWHAKGSDGRDMPVTTDISDSLFKIRIPQRIPNDTVHLWTEYATSFPVSITLHTNKLYNTAGEYIDSGNRRYIARYYTDATYAWSNMPITTNAYSRQPSGKYSWCYGRLACDGITVDFLSWFGGSILPPLTWNTDWSKQHPNYSLMTIDRFGFLLSMQKERGVYDNIPVFTTYNALQHRYPVDTTSIKVSNKGNEYSYIALIDTSGWPVYGTLLGGTDPASDVVFVNKFRGPDGSIAMEGWTNSEMQYVQPGGLQDSISDTTEVTSFIIRLTSTGDSIIYCTYLPSPLSVLDMNIGNDGRIAVLASVHEDWRRFPSVKGYQKQPGGLYDLLVFVISPRGDSVLWSSYLGGSLQEPSNYGSSPSTRSSIRIAPDGRVYVASSTSSNDFPLLHPMQSIFSTDAKNQADIILAGFSEQGALLFSTLWGGSDVDILNQMELTPCGEILLHGYTHSSDFPLHNVPAFQDTSLYNQQLYPRTKFIVLINPYDLVVRTSFIYPLPGIFSSIRFDHTGHLHGSGQIQSDYTMFNAYQHEADPDHGFLSRWYFPLCGEDCMLSTPMFRDTIVIDSSRNYISHDVFDLTLEVINTDTVRTAFDVRSTVDLPLGLLMLGNQPRTKSVTPSTLGPGMRGRVSWRVRLDTETLGGLQGMRNHIMHLKLTHEYKLSDALESCLSSFSFADYSIPIIRDDSEPGLVCSVTVDTVALSQDGRSFDLSTVTMTAEVRNTGQLESRPLRVLPNFGGMGCAVHPPEDSVRLIRPLRPGEAEVVSWQVRPGRRLDARIVDVTVVVSDEHGEATRCSTPLSIPAIPPLRCALQGPDTVRILKSGELVPPDIFTRILLSNVLDTLVGGAEVELDLLGVTHLRMWPGDTLRKLLGYVMPGGVRDARWQLELAQTPARLTIVPVTVRYRCDGLASGASA
jgi:hypothetical protein